MRQAWQYNGIKECNEEYGDPVEFGCAYFHGSRSAYYAWLSGKTCKRVEENKQIAENVLKRNFHAPKPNMKWLTDVTEFKWYEGVEVHKIYLSAILDLYDRAGACPNDPGLHRLLQQPAGTA